jgi:hypothetical protein
MRFLGIEVERKTDILALAAFFLSIAGVISQISVFTIFFLRGAVINVFPPEQVLIRAETLESGGPRYVRIGARMAYTNSGAPGYSAILRGERVTISVKSAPSF